MNYQLEIPKLNNCYIAYMDILGYKSYFDEYHDDDSINALLTNINASISEILKINILDGLQLQMVLNDKNISTNFFKVRTFSDNILIFFTDEANDKSKFILLGFLELIKEIQIKMITQYHLFIRGGVTKGSIAANDGFVFGKGLIDVVALEEKKAIYPRIIIDKKVMKDIDKFISDYYKLSIETKSELCNIRKCLLIKPMHIITNDMLLTFDKILALCEITGMKIDLYYNLYSKYRKLLKNTSSVNDIFKRLKEILPEFEKMNNILFNLFNNNYLLYKDRYESTISFDNDYAFINYLPLFHSTVTDKIPNEIANEVLDIYKNHLFPKENEEYKEAVISRFSHENDNLFENILIAHKLEITNQIEKCMEKYYNLRNTGSDLSILNRIIEKYLWVIKYHNDICKKFKYSCFSIGYVIEFDVQNKCTSINITH